MVVVRSTGAVVLVMLGGVVPVGPVIVISTAMNS